MLTHSTRFHDSRPLRGCLAFAVAVGLACCQTPDKDQSKIDDVSKADEPKPVLYEEATVADLPPESQAVNDTARLLAGLPAFDGQDSHGKWRGQDFWQTFQKGADAMWNEFSEKRGKKVRAWAAGEVADVNSQQVVFQPFNGPDFVFSHLLFPDVETFVLCGKEPCVDLPKLEDIDLAEMADTCFSLREKMAGVLGVVPGEMPETPPAAALPGALPMLMAIAARTGHVIESVELMPVDDKEAATADATAHPTSACVIQLRAPGGKVRRMFYFQQDLTDEGIPDNSALLSFLNKHDKLVVVLNGAGHALHQATGSRLQQYILNHGVAIVQDPTGLPHRAFDLAAWNLRAYGSYPGATDDAPDFDQPDLAAFYKDEANKPQSLPFGRGIIGKEQPAAIIVARPLVTSATDLPMNVNVTPLDVPAEPHATTSAPADEKALPVLPSLPPATKEQTTASAETFAPPIDIEALTKSSR